MDVKKRERDDGDRDAHIKTQEEIDAYNMKTKDRIEKNSLCVPCPQNKGLTEWCRIWRGGKDKGGYGLISYNGKQDGVHRVSFMISKGVNSLPGFDETGEQLQVAHICDIRDCCEPTHLYHATRTQNARDRTENGQMQGEKSVMAKISEETAIAIKLSKGQGTVGERAKRFATTKNIVSGIDNGYTWTHLPDANGNISRTKKIEYDKKVKRRRKKLKDLAWTKEMAEEAQKKFDDPDYAEKHPTYSFNGSPCKIWIREINCGYPKMSVCGQYVSAHIMACFIGNGYFRPKNMHAAHLCGHSLCVNPKHLKFKTPVENNMDKIAHGTHAHKLSWDQVLDIRNRHTRGETGRSISKLYNITPTCVSDIINNKSRIYG